MEYWWVLRIRWHPRFGVLREALSKEGTAARRGIYINVVLKTFPSSLSFRPYKYCQGIQMQGKKYHLYSLPLVIANYLG